MSSDPVENSGKSSWCENLGQITLGMIFMAHIAATVVLMYLRMSGVWGSYAIALIPLFALALEMVFLTTVSTICLISDRSPHSMQVLQNMLIALLITTSVLIIFFQIYRGEVKSWQAVLPVFIILASVAVKIAVSKSNQRPLSVTLISLAFAQITMLILKVDFEHHMKWSFVFLPTYSVSVIMIGYMMQDMQKGQHTSGRNDAYVHSMMFKMVLMLVFSIVGFLLASCLDKNFKFAPTLFIFSMILIVLISVEYAQKIGEFIFKLGTNKFERN